MNRKRTTTKDKAATATISDLVTAANQTASTLDPNLVVNIELRDQLGCESLAGELGITVEETRNLIVADWIATGDCGMFIQMLARGEKEIAAQFSSTGMSAAEVERTIAEAFSGIFSLKAVTRTTR
jgi:hypothetical protein